MKKYFIIIAILAILDLLCFNYLNNLEVNIKEYNLCFNLNPLLIQTKELIFKDINNFKFDQYFYIYSLNDYSLKYQFNDNNLLIKLNDNTYKFKYELEKPEVIEKIIYEQIKIPIQNETSDEYYEDDYFYVDSYELQFDINTDLQIIRDKLYENLNTTYQTSIDYSHVNVSQIGQYSVFYVTNDEKIEIFVKIV